MRKRKRDCDGILFQNSNRVIPQIGDKSLINTASRKISPDKAHSLSGKTKDLIDESSSSNTGKQASYAIVEESELDSKKYEKHLYEEVILYLENEDAKWVDNPWYLINRYLGTSMCPFQTHKSRIYYETILTISNSCEIDHFGQNFAIPIYTFSKVYIRRIISPNEWGISPLEEKEFIYHNNPIKQCYNYFDYIQAFYKAFYYENPKQKHSWLFKFDQEIFSQHRFPNWIHHWWKIYGPPISILPEPYKGNYTQWCTYTPHVNRTSQDYIEGSTNLYFFMEFGVPWIWKWVLNCGKDGQNIICLKRQFYSKFWPKLLKIDKKTNEPFGAQLTNQIYEQIAHYKDKAESQQREQDEESPFTQWMKTIQIRRPSLSKEEKIKLYFEEAKKHFLNNFEEDDRSLTTSMHSNPSECLAGGSRDPNEEDPSIADYFDSLKEVAVAKLTTKGKDKVEE